MGGTFAGVAGFDVNGIAAIVVILLASPAHENTCCPHVASSCSLVVIIYHISYGRNPVSKRDF